MAVQATKPKKPKKSLEGDSWAKMPWFKDLQDLIKKEGEIQQMKSEDFFKLSRKLEDMHSIFYKFWEVGAPYFTYMVSTAAIGFDNKTGNFCSFVFNPMFWKWLGENVDDENYTRLFIISHEMLHLILRHGLRAKDCDQKRLANVCLDIVINHLLINRFGFQREKVKGADSLCWIDTTFTDNPDYKGPEVEENKHFAYYYLLAKKYLQNAASSKRKLSPGDVVWNRKTKAWGIIKSVDEKNGTIQIEPVDKKTAIAKCKEDYHKGLVNV